MDTKNSDEEVSNSSTRKEREREINREVQSEAVQTDHAPLAEAAAAAAASQQRPAAASSSSSSSSTSRNISRWNKGGLPLLLPAAASVLLHFHGVTLACRETVSSSQQPSMNSTEPQPALGQPPGLPSIPFFRRSFVLSMSAPLSYQPSFCQHLCRQSVLVRALLLLLLLDMSAAASRRTCIAWIAT